MLGQKSQKPWIRLVRRKASDRLAGDAAARFHGRNDFFHASNRRARDGFAIEFHIETAVPLGGDADRGSVLSRAAKKKIAKPVTGGSVGDILFAAQQESAGAIAEEAAEFADDATRGKHAAVHVGSDHDNPLRRTRANQRLRDRKSIEQP